MPSPLAAQPISFVLIHLIFSTRAQRPWLDVAIAPEMHGVIAASIAAQGQSCLRVGGTADHVHIALKLRETTRLDRLIARTKLDSTRWYKQKLGDGSGETEFDRFAWQRGHAAFSVSPADRLALVHYIDTQREVHARKGFQDEMRGLFAKYDVQIDERFFWK